MLLEDVLLPEGDYQSLNETYRSLPEEESKKIMKQFTELHQTAIDEHCEVLAEASFQDPVAAVGQITTVLPEEMRMAIVRYIDEQVPEYMMVLKVIMYLSLCKGTADYIKERTSQLWFKKVKEQIKL